MITMVLLFGSMAVAIISAIMLVECKFGSETPWIVILISSVTIMIGSGSLGLISEKMPYDNILVESRTLKPINEGIYLEISTEDSDIYLSYIEADSYFNTIHKKLMGNIALIKESDAEEPQIKIYEKVFENNFWSYFYTRSKYTYVFEVPACSIKYSCVKTE